MSSNKRELVTSECERIGKAKIIECYDNIITPWYRSDLKNPSVFFLDTQKNEMHYILYAYLSKKKKKE